MSDKKVLLLVVAVLLSLSYITPMWRLHDKAQLGVTLLFAAGLWDAVTRLHSEHKIEKNGMHSLVSGIGIGALIVTNFKFYSPLLVRLTPLIGGVLLILFFFNKSGLRIYCREISILTILSIRQVITPFLPDPSVLTAFFSSHTLNLIGFDVLAEGSFIVVNSAKIQVFRGCSGLEYMTYLLSLSGLAMLLFPLRGFNRWLVFFVSVVVGFGVNSLRVSLLVVLYKNGNMINFDYWHEGNGSLLFGAFAVAVFGAYYLSAAQRNCNCEKQFVCQ